MDFVVEMGAIDDGIAMLRPDRYYYVIGYRQNLNIPTIDIISTEINFIGNLIGTYNDLAELMTPGPPVSRCNLRGRASWSLRSPRRKSEGREKGIRAIDLGFARSSCNSMILCVARKAREVVALTLSGEYHRG